jgi:taurine transport system substrate-binding protein
MTNMGTTADRRTLLNASLGLGGAVVLGTLPRQARAAGPDKINIAFFTETSPSAIAKANGWLEDVTKAKINWINVGSGAEINTAIAAGSVDIGIGSAPTAASLLTA